MRAIHDFFSPALQVLIEKYSGQSPRYTSYPTAVEFSPSYSVERWRSALAAERREGLEEVGGYGQKPTYSLYFHIPFCQTLCYFCACNKVISLDRKVVSPYLDSLLAELRAYREILGPDILIEQIHWGGGTPNYLHHDEMVLLHQTCLECFPNIQPKADISLEIDPRTTTEKQLETLAALGFNRISLGVQDFNPIVQRTVNRIQSYELTRDICIAARALGFGGINIDLIYGLPNQTIAGLEATAENVIEIRPNRLALYGYAHVTWLKKVQKVLERAQLPSPKQRIELFLSVLGSLTAAGYQHIGMDHFALPDDELSLALLNGRLNRNFMGYTSHRGARVLGFGASAVSSLPNAYAQNAKEVAQYQQLVDKHGLATVRGLMKTEQDGMRGEIIEAILCQGEISITEFEKRWNIDFHTSFAESVSKLSEYAGDQLIVCDREKIVLSPIGRLFSRNIASAFDSYLPQHLNQSRKVFSQSV